MKKYLPMLIIALLAAMPAFAQTTITLTEADVNTVLDGVVANIDEVEDLNLNFTDDTAIITATVTAEDGETVSVAVRMAVVQQEDGEGFYWEVTDASVNDFNVPQRTIDDINTALQSAEFQQLRTSSENNVLADATIDEDDITYTVNEELAEALENFEFDPENIPTFDPENPPTFDPENIPTFDPENPPTFDPEDASTVSGDGEGSRFGGNRGEGRSGPR